MLVQGCLQEIRKARGISAADLARRVGVTRQTIYAIEEGNFVPNTAVSLQLSRALEVTVEEIFSITDEQEPEPITANLLAGSQAADGQLVRLCRVNKQFQAIPVSSVPVYLPAADGTIESRTRSTVSVNSTIGLPEEGKRLLLAGCDPALSFVNEALRTSEFEVISVLSPSRRALQWLKQGRVHAAGAHLLDRATGNYNLPIIKRLIPNSSVRVVTFAMWEQGLILRRGNPKNIRSIADLGRKDVTLINREAGSGSKNLLDSALRELGIPSEQVKGYNAIAEGHLAAAYAVASGTADCCLAPRSAANCFGLDFVALAVERFDISFTEASFELPAAKALLDVLNRAHLRKKLQSIAGYDTAHTGEVLI